MRQRLRSFYHGLRAYWRGDYRPPVGHVHFGSLRRLTPISVRFGYDRGQPVDRYYIEQFLSRHSEDIQGRVLEVGDNSYTLKYGSCRVVTSDILHVTSENPKATIIADLARADHVPSDTFDCIILTQTLHLIYDLQAATQTLYRILKPGGVLLATCPGISPIDHGEWGGCWNWAFTTRAVEQLFAEAFPAQRISVHSYGNVLVAVAFLHGLAAKELSQEELNYDDPHYQLLIAVRAEKPEGFR